jgi:glycosyltransferase involved in cell wall biosynthesis
MRILIVAQADSIHTARWISQINQLGWDIHLFPSQVNGRVHPSLQNVSVHHSLYLGRKGIDPTVHQLGIPVGSEYLLWVGNSLLEKYFPHYRVAQLNRLIKKLQPDIVHSMELQNAGYLTWAAKNQYLKKFPKWIVTNWGSDIYLFKRLRDHVDRIRAVMASCDYYTCECQRDVELAKEMGLEGEVLAVLPSSGGFDVERAIKFRKAGLSSHRRLLVLKGYQGWAGRSMVGLRAIELCADNLQDYRVSVYLANKDVKIAAELVSHSTGIPIDFVPYCSHDEMLQVYGQARIYIGLSISDAISTSLIEAMVMGAFPIQSCTSCANEWIISGESGFIVPPEDPEPVAAAIRRAILDDKLVDRAAERNLQVARERLDIGVIRPKVISMYQQVFEASK